MGSAWPFGVSAELGMVRLITERNGLLDRRFTRLHEGREPLFYARRMIIEHMEHQVAFTVSARDLVRFGNSLEKIRQPGVYDVRKVFRPRAVMRDGWRIRSQ